MRYRLGVRTSWKYQWNLPPTEGPRQEGGAALPYGLPGHNSAFTLKAAQVYEARGRVFDMRMGRPPYALLHQGGHAFVAEAEPDAISLTFTMRSGRADKFLLRMASMHWYAERVD